MGSESGTAFLGSGTWASVCEGRDVIQKSYNKFFFFLKDVMFYKRGERKKELAFWSTIETRNT